MMVSYKLSMLVLFYLFLFFIGKANSISRTAAGAGRRSRNSIEEPLSNCSRCVEIRRCSSLRNRMDWKTAGETCEFGYGEYRKVCCPRSPKFLSIQNKQTPTPPTLVMFGSAPSSDCGLSERDNSRQLSSQFGAEISLEDAPEGAWPWMVAIRYLSSSGIFVPMCSGFLIDKIHVLSAAHCFNGKEFSLYSTRIGSVNQNEGDEYPVIRIKVHNGYRRGQFYDDIAILTLNKEVNFPNFYPICLPDQLIMGRDLTGRKTTEVAWAADIQRKEIMVHLKQLSQIPIWSNSECNAAYRNLLGSSYTRTLPRGVNDGVICAGYAEERKKACMGISGGPLMIRKRNKWYAVGLASFGRSCGKPGIPQGYTRVTHYLNWIRKNT